MTTNAAAVHDSNNKNNANKTIDFMLLRDRDEMVCLLVAALLYLRVVLLLVVVVLTTFVSFVVDGEATVRKNE